MVWPVNASPNWKLYSARSETRAVEWLLCPFVINRIEGNTLASATLLQPTKAAAMSTTCDYTPPPPPIPSHLLLLAQNLSCSKQMLSKLHDGYTLSSVVKGLTCKRGCHIAVACTFLLNKAHLGGFIDFQPLFLTRILCVCPLSLSLHSFPLSSSSHTRYSDREHPQKQLTLWAISWSIPPPLASTLWRRVPTRSLVSFDNLGHGCPMAKSSLHCLTLPNKVGVVGSHKTVLEIHPAQCMHVWKYVCTAWNEILYFWIGHSIVLLLALWSCYITAHCVFCLELHACYYNRGNRWSLRILHKQMDKEITLVIPVADW